MGRSKNVSFILTKMRADGHLLGLSRLCQIGFDDNFYMSGRRNESVLNIFAKLFPELEDTEDPSRLVFIDDENGDKIFFDNLGNLDFDLSCILKQKYKFNEEKNYTEMNKGKPIRLGIVKRLDERQNIKSIMLNAADVASTSQEN